MFAYVKFVFQTYCPKIELFIYINAFEKFKFKINASKIKFDFIMFFFLHKISRADLIFEISWNQSILIGNVQKVFYL